MKCDMCENEATVFLTQIIDGKMNQVNLCDKCSKENGVTDPTGFQLADFLVGTAQKKTKGSSLEDDSLACPNCGFTRAHLKKIGRMGCPECYATFAADLENMLRAMHKGTRHVGKVPSRQQLIQHTPDPNAETQPAEAQEPEGEDGINASQDVDETPSLPPLPPPPPPVVNVKKRIQELKQAIEKAVVDERYEDAAKLRDEVRELESKSAD